MGTYTSKFQLYKPDPSEFVDVARDLSANWDKLAATGSTGAVERSELTAIDSDLQGQINDLKTSVFGSTSRTKVPACKISKGGTQNIPNNTVTDVAFGEVTWESEGSMSDLAHNKIVVPVAGIYLCHFQWIFDPGFSGIHRGWILTGGAKRASAKFPGEGLGAGAGFAPGQVMFLMNASAGTEVSASVWQNSGSGNPISNVESGTYLAVVRVSDRIT